MTEPSAPAPTPAANQALNDGFRLALAAVRSFDSTDAVAMQAMEYAETALSNAEAALAAVRAELEGAEKQRGYWRGRALRAEHRIAAVRALCDEAIQRCRSGHGTVALIPESDLRSALGSSGTGSSNER